MTDAKGSVEPRKLADRVLVLALALVLCAVVLFAWGQGHRGGCQPSDSRLWI